MARRYALRAVVSPTCMTMMLTVGTLALCCSGILGAGVFTFATAAVAVNASSSRFVRRRLDRASALRDRRRREDARLELLRATSDERRDQYIELRTRIGELATHDDTSADQLELEALLDDFVHIAVRHRRCIEALDLTAGSASANASSERLAALASRRVRAREATWRHAQELAEQLDAIVELVQLVAHRLAWLELGEEPDAGIEQRLLLLDELTAS